MVEAGDGQRVEVSRGGWRLVETRRGRGGRMAAARGWRHRAEQGQSFSLRWAKGQRQWAKGQRQVASGGWSGGGSRAMCGGQMRVGGGSETGVRVSEEPVLTWA